MIEFRKGNILECNAEALVNSVNCVGVMGRGIALQFKRAYPENFKLYAAACRRGEVQPGRMLVYDRQLLTRPRWIINFPTKRHWRGKSRLEDIEAGLRALKEEIERRGIRSVALPPLGCGLGGLKWEEVRRLIEEILGNLSEVQVVVFEPEKTVGGGYMPHTGEIPKMTPARAALLGLMAEYLKGSLVPFVSLLELHKLVYFLQAAGEPLRLRFTKGSYGPYAENLRHVLHAMEGYFITGYGPGGDQPEKTLELVPGAGEEATRVLQQNPQIRERFERVRELIEGFESPHGLELLATVHWIVAHDCPSGENELIEQFYAWAERKRQFTPRQIRLAARVLTEKGWADSYKTTDHEENRKNL